MFTRMRLSWRLLLLRTYLQKPTSFSYRKAQSLSISSPFHTQSRTHHTQTINSSNLIYPCGSFESKIGVDFSLADGVTKEKRDELEKDLKSVAVNRNAIEEKGDEHEENLKSITENKNAIEEKRDELEKDLKSVAENRNAIEEKRNRLEEDLKSITENRNAVEEKRDEVEEDLMAILEHRNGIDVEEALQTIAKIDAMKTNLSEAYWDSSYIEAVDTLIKFTDADDIKRELDHLKFDQDLIKNVLEGFESNPNVAKRFFHFLLDKDSEELDYECYGALYNSMLCVFGVNRLFDEFWDLAETMNIKRCRVSSSACKERRYLIHIDTWEKVSEFCCKHGLVSELQKLNVFVVIQYMDNRMINIVHLLNSVGPKMWKDKISDQLCGDFVKFVLEHASHMEALRFLQWIAGNDNLCELDEQTYDTIASVLGKKDDKYSKLVDGLMCGKDYGKWEVTMEITKWYECAVACSDTVPSVNCCIYLIMKIRLYDDMLAFSNDVNPYALGVVDAFEKNGGILTDSDVDEVINMVVSGNKIKHLDALADDVMHSRYLKVRDHPFSFTESYTEIDRQRRARLMFSDFQETSGNK